MISKSSGKSISISDFFKKKANIRIVYAVLIIAIALLSFGSFMPEKKPVGEKSVDMVDHEMERKLQNILSEIEGVGSARVLITYRSKGEVVPAVNKDRKAEREREEGAAARETQRTEENEELVIIGSGASQAPFIVKELTPAVQGVIVIAEGGNDPKVKQSITEAVTVLTGVSPHNVGVFPKRK